MQASTLTNALVSNCAARVAILFVGAVAVPAVMVTYMTEVCTHRAFQHYSVLEAARGSA